MGRTLSPKEALEWLEKTGVALHSAKGPIPNVVEAIAGEPIRGSWWAHAHGTAIFNALEQVVDSGEVLSFRLLNGKLTYVHRRLWPVLARAAAFLTAEQVTAVTQQHTERGHHKNVETPFPSWASKDVLAASKNVTEAQAREVFGMCVAAPKKKRATAAKGPQRPLRARDR